VARIGPVDLVVRQHERTGAVEQFRVDAPRRLPTAEDSGCVCEGEHLPARARVDDAEARGFEQAPFEPGEDRLHDPLVAMLEVRGRIGHRNNEAETLRVKIGGQELHARSARIDAYSNLSRDLRLSWSRRENAFRCERQEQHHEQNSLHGFECRTLRAAPPRVTPAAMAGKGGRIGRFVLRFAT